MSVEDKPTDRTGGSRGVAFPFDYARLTEHVTALHLQTRLGFIAHGALFLIGLVVFYSRYGHCRESQSMIGEVLAPLNELPGVIELSEDDVTISIKDSPMTIQDPVVVIDSLLDGPVTEVGRLTTDFDCLEEERLISM